MTNHATDEEIRSRDEFGRDAQACAFSAAVASEIASMIDGYLDSRIGRPSAARFKQLQVSVKILRALADRDEKLAAFLVPGGLPERESAETWDWSPRLVERHEEGSVRDEG